jgi:hypothetical protein
MFNKFLFLIALAFSLAPAVGAVTSVTPTEQYPLPGPPTGSGN